MRLGFLTKEERLVFLALSICLTGGALFQLIDSLFVLPEALTPDVLQSAVSDTSRRDVVSPDRDGDASSQPTAESCRLSGKLDLNAATPAELEALPGIGPVLAERIISYRQESGGFRSVDELLAVKGIGNKTLDRFREWVCVSPQR